MGWASKNEDDWEAIRDRVDPVPEPGPPPPSFPCPVCARGFNLFHDLAAHLAEVHAQRRPRLLLGSREPAPAGTVIRRPIALADVHLAHVTRAEVEVDGRHVAGALAPTLERLREGRVLIRLENAADPGRLRPEVMTYDLDFRVADDATLDAIELAFSKALDASGEALTAATVDAFLRACRGAGWAGNEYAKALTCYLSGVLTKDQAPDTGVLPAMAEYEEKYKEALASLADSPRPLAQLVTGLTRFALNEYPRAPVISGFARLDKVVHRLARLAGRDWPALPVSAAASSTRRRRVCPTDTGTDAVLAAGEEIEALPRWGRPAVESLHARIRGLDRFPADRAKITALAAEAALRFGARDDGSELLRKLINESAIFGTWAEHALVRLESA